MILDVSPASIHLHFIGIGGIGMSGIAQVLLNQGFSISGSDLMASEGLEKLKLLGARIFLGHRAEHIAHPTAVVISSAVSENNVEYREAKRKRIPVISRAEMLAELMRGKTGVAVAGAHGKTSTTSLLTWTMNQAGLDPTAVIGGRVDALGGDNFQLGKSQFLIAEADESDGSFLHLPATFSIITNIDNDHLDYFKTQDRIDGVFIEFVAKLPFYGLAFVCGEDLGIQRCWKSFSKPFATYGFSSEWDWFAQNVSLSPQVSQFEVFKKDTFGKPFWLGEVELGIPGEHQVLNALSVIALADRLRIPFEIIKKSLKSFRGAKRRFEVCWEKKKNQQVIIDDYGHHPTEIRATLKTARHFWPSGRIVSVFQPHRYSRTFHCWEEFLSCFAQCDVLLLTQLYPAGEPEIPGIDSKRLAHDIALKLPGVQVIYTGSLDETVEKVLEIFSPGDLLLCQGAGSITQLPARLLAKGLDCEAKV